MKVVIFIVFIVWPEVESYSIGGRKDGLQCDFLKSWRFTDVLELWLKATLSPLVKTTAHALCNLLKLHLHVHRLLQRKGGTVAVSEF
jgi:hypothetical protein